MMAGTYAIDGSNWKCNSANEPHSIQYYRGEGLRRFRFEVQPGDEWSGDAGRTPSYERAELANLLRFPQDQSLEISFTQKLSWAGTIGQTVVVGQWHDGDVVPGISPIVAAEIQTDGTWSIYVRGSTSDPNVAKNYLYNDPDFEQDRVYSHRVVVTLSPTNGHLLWERDGVAIVNQSVPIDYSGNGDGYWINGIYRIADSASTIVAEYDELTSPRAI